MGTLTPFRIAVLAQDSAAQEDAPAATAGTEQPPQEPWLTATDTQLWVGFGAFITVFFFILVAIIRARVIKPAERMARETDFFEPAGAHADITFDDPAQAYADIKDARKKDRKKKADKKPERKDQDEDAATEIVSDDTADDAAETLDSTGRDEDAPVVESEPEPQMAEIAAAIDNAVVAEDPEEKKAAPFADLFSRNEADRDETPQDEQAGESGDQEALALTMTPDDVRLDHLPEIDESYWDAERQRREAAEYERAEEERRIALEEASRARMEADAERRRQEEAAREAEMRLAASERREADAALERRMQAMSAMQGKLDAMAERLSKDTDDVETRIGAALEKKFEGLSDELHGRLQAAAAEIDRMQEDAGARERTESESTLMIAAHIEALQKAIEAALTDLSKRIDVLGAAQSADPVRSDELRRLNTLLSERAAPAVAGMLQLGDLVRSALPADRFTFDKELANGAKADCIIKRPGAAPFAIDARYPAEAFDRYARADEKSRDHTATAYRRAVLRHMIFVAEKLITPEETADFAILFVPNDTVFNDLHQNFADIVQDSYRARIWIASPTSLMATLHMMNAASQLEDDAPAGDEDELRIAVAALTDRIGALEESLARAVAPTPEPADIPQTTPVDQPVAEQQEAPEADTAQHEATPLPINETEEAEIEIIGADAAPADEAEGPSEASRPPFPLR